MLLGEWFRLPIAPASDVPDARERAKRVGLGCWCLVCLVAGILLRFLAARGELWFDEVWSVEFARAVSSPWKILTIHHDNNHWLYTFLLYGLGAPSRWWGYRVPSLIAGTLVIILTTLIARRDGRWPAAMACLLASVSSFLVYYSSEARGYALAMGWALLAFVSMERYLRSPGRLAHGCLTLSIALGCLSHLTFIHVYLALVCWSVAAFLERRCGWPSVIRNLARCHWAPLAFMGTLYLIDIRFLRHGGGAVRPVWDVVVESLAISAGAPKTPSVVIGVSAALLGAALYECLQRKRERSSDWIFFASLIVASPIVMGVWFDFVYPRHFVICLPFLLVLWSRFLARCAREGVVGRLMAAAAVLLMCWGHGARIRDLMERGRGHHLEALRYMADRTDGGVVTIGGSADEFLHQALVRFYRRYLPDSVSVMYYDADHWPMDGTQWLLVHTQDYEKGGAPPLGVVAWRDDHRYLLTRVFRVADLAGWDLFVYRRLGR